MKYRILFSAQNARGTTLMSLALEIGPFYPENPNEPMLAIGDLKLQRLCVEYARLRGVSCSCADIHSIDEVTE